METRTYQVYKYQELPREAQEKALENWRIDMDYTFLEEYMNELLAEKLTKNKITTESEETSLEYDLSYCQGSHVSFSGRFFLPEYPDYVFNISRSYNLEINYKDDHEHAYEMPDDPEYSKAENAFLTIYKQICKELFDAGRSYIEEEDKEENIVAIFDANDYYFTINGKID